MKCETKAEAEYVVDIVSERAIHKEFVFASAAKLSEIGEQLRQSQEVSKALLKALKHYPVCHCSSNHKCIRCTAIALAEKGLK